MRETSINVFDIGRIQETGVTDTALMAIKKIVKPGTQGFWIHIDVDVLNYNDVPAVDYRLSGGLGYNDLSELIQVLLRTGRAVGMDVTIFNPKLDLDGSLACRLVSSLVAGLSCP